MRFKHRGGMNLEKSLAVEKLDEEWITLIEEAKQIGLNKEEVRSFLLSKAEVQANSKTSS